MKKLVIAVLLCSCATSCDRKDTRRAEVWLRAVEPRLTGATGPACRNVECPPAGELVDEKCAERIESQHDALVMLASQRQCTDRAIESLEALARSDARIWSDVAAAYYLRARRKGRDSDLLRALEAAEHAVRTRPDNSAAQFNLALVQEAAGLQENAITSWNAMLKIEPRSPWADEARRRLTRLRAPAVSAPWLVQRRTLGAALARGDRAFARKVVAEFPTPALDYLKEERLPENHANLLASELSLRRGGDAARADELVARGFALNTRSRYLESLSHYNTALETFVRLRDADMIASIRRSRIGLFRRLGQPELAWSEALRALPDAPRVGNTRRRQMVFAEAATTAAILGYPRAALLYQDAAIRSTQRDVAWTHDVEEIHRLLASARRIRAAIELQLGWLKDAENDLAEATRLIEEESPEQSQALQARIQEVRGRSLMSVDPAAAAEAFTRALNAAEEGELKSVRASLYAQRAEAEQQRGHKAEAERDLEEALRELREEEAGMLEDREPGEGEDVWRAYFARFHETYDRLIQLTDSKEKAFNYKERSLAYEPLNLILEREVAPPAFRRLVPRGDPMSLAAVASQLPPGTVLLQYAVLDQGTYAWIVRRGRARHVTLKATRRDVERYSQVAQRAVSERDVNLLSETLTFVYEALLAAPLAAAGEKPRRLVIVPDGAMHGLPFAALYDAKASQYLFEKAPIELAGSATLYVFALMRDATLPSAASPSVLLIGDPAFDPRSDLGRGFDRLPGARAEVERIRALYAPHIHADVLTGAEATFAALRSHARNCAIVHVAGHSIVNAQQPWQSMLLLAQAGDDSGAVEAEKLVTELELDRTRLFVLAACSSAGGLPVGPEGVAPLVRPLIAAGVPAVMGSLWDVEDATAERLSVSFHQAYGQGHDAATALQAAQRAMLGDKSPLVRSVLAWAPFQVIGHASSPFARAPLKDTGGTHLGIHRTDSLQRDDGLHPEQ